MCGFTEKGRIRCNRIDCSNSSSNSTERENAYEFEKRNDRFFFFFLSPPNDDKFRYPGLIIRSRKLG